LIKKNSIFHYNGLIIETHSEVYNPAEDTFQLLESIKIEKNNFVLELGSGCGIIALSCAKEGADVIATDINPNAIELIKCNFLRNQFNLKGTIEVRIGDLFNPIQAYEKFDVIIFNPPYLPTTSDQKIGGSGWFDLAIDGGLDGLSVTKKFIVNLPKFLKKNGKAYFVFSSLSKKDILEKFLKKNSFDFEIVNTKSFNGETIDIYKIKIKK
jgi:release factor glutamine methyltransferase